MQSQPANSDTDLLRALNTDLEDIAVQLNSPFGTLDMYFLAYLRRFARFGYFTFGPIHIDVGIIERIVESTARRVGPQVSDAGAFADANTQTAGDADRLERLRTRMGDDMVRFSRLLASEVQRSGRRRIDELHILLAFMRTPEGLPARVFGELGVKPEQVEEFARTGKSVPAALEKLYSPEEAAEYLNVHIQTVRSWIRSGRLRARRLAGQRALRITASDLEAVLEPLDATDEV